MSRFAANLGLYGLSIDVDRKNMQEKIKKSIKESIGGDIGDVLSDHLHGQKVTDAELATLRTSTTYNADIKDLADEINNLVASAGSNPNSALHTQLSQLKVSLQQSKDTVTALGTEKFTLEQEKAVLESKASSLQTQIDALKAVSSGNNPDENLQNLQDIIDGLRSSIEEKDSEISAKDAECESKIKTLKEEFESTEAEAARVNAEAINKATEDAKSAAEAAAADAAAAAAAEVDAAKSAAEAADTKAAAEASAKVAAEAAKVAAEESEAAANTALEECKKSLKKLQDADSSTTNEEITRLQEELETSMESLRQAELKILAMEKKGTDEQFHTPPGSPPSPATPPPPESPEPPANSLSERQIKLLELQTENTDLGLSELEHKILDAQISVLTGTDFSESATTEEINSVLNSVRERITKEQSKEPEEPESSQEFGTRTIEQILKDEKETIKKVNESISHSETPYGYSETQAASLVPYIIPKLHYRNIKSEYKTVRVTAKNQIHGGDLFILDRFLINGYKENGEESETVFNTIERHDNRIVRPVKVGDYEFNMSKTRVFDIFRSITSGKGVEKNFYEIPTVKNKDGKDELLSDGHIQKTIHLLLVIIGTIGLTANIDGSEVQVIEPNPAAIASFSFSDMFVWL